MSSRSADNLHNQWEAVQPSATALPNQGYQISVVKFRCQDFDVVLNSKSLLTLSLTWMGRCSYIQYPQDNNPLSATPPSNNDGSWQDPEEHGHLGSDPLQRQTSKINSPPTSPVQSLVNWGKECLKIEITDLAQNSCLIRSLILIWSHSQSTEKYHWHSLCKSFKVHGKINEPPLEFYPRLTPQYQGLSYTRCAPLGWYWHSLPNTILPKHTLDSVLTATKIQGCVQRINS